MELSSRIFVPNHYDLIGSSIINQLKSKGYNNIIINNNNNYDYTDEESVNDFFAKNKPEYVFCFVGSHGGIIKNISYPADIMYEVLKVQVSLIHSAYKYNVRKLLFLAGNCIYPKYSKQPILEDYFMDGKMEPTSAAYSTARAAGVELCWAYNRQYGTCFVPAILPNYFGPGDDYSENGHVLASILHKIHQAKLNNVPQLILWGTGTPKRQFMFSQDIARACILIMNSYESTELINIAGGHEFTISEISSRLKNIIGYKGNIIFDSSKPDGTLRKFLDNSKLKKLHFTENFSFNNALQLLYQDYLSTFRDN